MDIGREAARKGTLGCTYGKKQSERGPRQESDDWSKNEAVGAGPGQEAKRGQGRRLAGGMGRPAPPPGGLRLRRRVAQGEGDDRFEEDVALVEVAVPLRDPAWSPDERALIALGEDGRRLAKVDVTPGGINPSGEFPVAAAVAEELEDGVAAGENLALERGRTPDKVFVPIPERDHIKTMENDDLLEVRTFYAGEAPTRVAFDTAPGAPGIAFALPEDGRTVTVVSLETYEVIAELEAGEGGLIESPPGGSGFWVAGPDGVAFYPDLSPESRATAPVSAGALAADATDAERAYVAESGSGRVVALEPRLKGRLEVVAETDLGEEVAYLAAEEGAVYAATASKLVVLDPASLEPRRTVEFATELERGSLEGAALSGLAVAEDALYLTLEGEPFVVRIRKP